MSNSRLANLTAVLGGSDGYISIKAGLLRCELQNPSPDGSSADEQRLHFRAHLDQCERTHWPPVWSALLKGELSAYGVVPGCGMQAIDPHFWAFLPSGKIPAALQWDLTRNHVHPVLRVGDLEWFIARQSGRAVWTVDQAFIWICTRDAGWVQRADPELRDKRITWPQFLQTGNFPKTTPGEALFALKADLQAARLKAWAGLRPFWLWTVPNAEWHRVIDDAQSFWTLKNFRNELHAVMLDPADVQALYPAATAELEGPPMQVAVSRRGPKQKYGWHDFETEVGRQLDEEGGLAPANGSSFTQARLEERMRDWCQRNWEDVPGESSIRDRVSKSIKARRP